jgi:hypothetical protein
VSENLIHNVAPHLAPPVTRERIRSASEVGGGASLALLTSPPMLLFADDDAE